MIHNSQNSAARSQRSQDTPNVVHKKIKLKEQNLEWAGHVSQKFGLSEVAARIVAARDFSSDKDIEDFLNPTLKKGLPLPSLLKGIKEAVALIQEAVENGLKIAICCDFDVDGLTGGSQLYDFLGQIGAKREIYIPNRFIDGYGLNENIVEKAKEDSCSLLVTIDFGTTNFVELKLAGELDIKTIVIDHHEIVGEAPLTDAFINPHQDGCGFAGCTLSASGLTWYLVAALSSRLEAAKDISAKSYLDLACLGTICDMVPLTGVNRVLARRGLEALTYSERPGLINLKKTVGIRSRVGCSHVGFGLGPRINAAGRMDTGEIVIELLTSDDEAKTAKLAEKIDKLNKKRQATEEKVKERVLSMLPSSKNVPWGIVSWHRDFHIGVIGIVAQRLVEMFYRPTAIIGYDNGMFKGSVRGVKGFNVIEALTTLSEHLVKFGGHEGAGGFSIEESKLEIFRERFAAYCENELGSKSLKVSSLVDTEANLSDISRELIKELEKFEPHGIGNPRPNLLIRNLKVLEVKILKGSHLKAMLSDGKRFIPALMWKRAHHPHLKSGAKVDISCKPQLNVFNGIEELQLVLDAVEPH